MITIDWVPQATNNSSLGNHLFQVALAKILAEKCGHFLSDDVILNGPISKRWFPQLKGNDGFISRSPITYVMSGNKIKIPGDMNLKIAKNGYFQRYEYYKPYKEDIKKWLDNIGIGGERLIHNDDLVLHYRLGDYIKNGYIMNPSWVKETLKGINFRQLWIVTDDPLNLPKELDYFEPVKLTNQNHYLDFIFIERFNNIFISQSTFSWWAAWLSNASKIYFPILKNGVWPKIDGDPSCDKETRDINLIVDDEPRYVYVEE